MKHKKKAQLIHDPGDATDAMRRARFFCLRGHGYPGEPDAGGDEDAFLGMVANGYDECRHPLQGKFDLLSRPLPGHEKPPRADSLLKVKKEGSYD